MAGRYILVDEDFQDEMRRGLKELKLLFTSSSSKVAPSEDLMDTADAMAYLKVSRRTLYKYRTKNGLPFEQMEDGKIFYSRARIQQFLKDGNNQNR